MPWRHIAAARLSKLTMIGLFNVLGILTAARRPLSALTTLALNTSARPRRLDPSRIVTLFYWTIYLYPVALPRSWELSR